MTFFAEAFSFRFGCFFVVGCATPSQKELYDLQGVFEEYRTASSERAAAAFLRARGRASLRAAIWRWRVIGLQVR